MNAIVDGLRRRDAETSRSNGTAGAFVLRHEDVGVRMAGLTEYHQGFAIDVVYAAAIESLCQKDVQAVPFSRLALSGAAAVSLRRRG
jgi:hypothetical protein